MKLKGINPLEQHVEQIVLVTVSGIFLVVVAAQFLLDSNRIKVGSQELPPGKAFEPAAQRAAVVKAQLDRTEVEYPEIPSVNVADDFRQRLKGPIAPAQTLAASLGPAMQLENVIDVGSQLGREIAAVAVPAPQPVAAHAYRFTIDPTVPLSIPDLKPYLPEVQPLDAAAVSVEASLDGQALRTALASGGDKAIPELWWGGGRTAVLGVRLEREELTEPGTWGNLTEIAPPPGRFDGVQRAAELTPEAGAGAMSDLVMELTAGAQEDVLRPRFYRTIAGQEWVPPSKAQESAPIDNTRVNQLLARLRSIRDSEQRLLDAREAAGAPREPRNREGAGGGGGTGKGGGGGAVTPPPTGREPAANPRVVQIDRQLERNRQQQQEVIDDLASMNLDEAGNPLPKEQPNLNQGFQQQSQIQVLEDTGIQVYTHDLSAQPGKTYRYRIRIAINNPAFGRGAALIPEQQEIAANPVLMSEPSAWTSPVTVPADRYYFITSASEGGMLGSAGAQAEVYEFFYGYYRRGSTRLEPGDKLIAQVKLPEAAKLPIYDLTKLPSAQQPGIPTPQLPPEGERGRAPMNVNPGVQPGPQTGQAPLALPEGATPWDKPIIAQEDVILLDVARIPGESKAVAVLRGPSGSILRLTPDQDPTGMYQKVKESAAAGETQGQPVIREPEPERERPRPGERLPQPEPATPGGGGGGGGGAGGG